MRSPFKNLERRGLRETEQERQKESQREREREKEKKSEREGEREEIMMEQAKIIDSTSRYDTQVAYH